jgi:hypothetical protein
MRRRVEVARPELALAKSAIAAPGKQIGYVIDGPDRLAAFASQQPSETRLRRFVHGRGWFRTSDLSRVKREALPVQTLQKVPAKRLDYGLSDA